MVNSSEIIAVSRQIIKLGPRRVLIEKDRAVTHRQAMAQCGWYTGPDIVFIRDDGWSVGAPTWLELDAFALWPKEYVAYMRRPSPLPKPMTSYRPPLPDL